MRPVVRLDVSAGGLQGALALFLEVGARDDLEPRRFDLPDDERVAVEPLVDRPLPREHLVDQVLEDGSARGGRLRGRQRWGEAVVTWWTVISSPFTLTRSATPTAFLIAAHHQRDTQATAIANKWFIFIFGFR